MSKSVSTALKVILSVGLASVILYFVFRKIDIAEFLSMADKVDYSWVILSMLVSLIGYVLRAYRWRLQLNPLGHNPTTYRMFLAVMSGYLANLLLPRLGEVTRCGVLLKSDKVPVSVGFGTVITERIIDMLALLIIILITLGLQSEQLGVFLSQTVNTSINWYLIVTVGLGIMGVGTWVFFKFVYPSKTKIGEFSRGLISGLISLKDIKVLKFTLVTIAIWIVYFFMSYLVIFSMPQTEHLPWQAGFSILTAGVIAFVIPVQSGFGTFHALVSAMLLIYGIDQTTGVFFASLLHGSQLIAVLIYGLTAVILSIFVKKHEHETQDSK